MLKSMGLQIGHDLAAELNLPGSSDDKVSERHTVGDPGSIPGWGRSPGKGNGNPLQHSCLENPMDGGVWKVKSTASQRAGHN